MKREEAVKRVEGYLTDYLPADCYGEIEEIMKALEEPSINKPCVSTGACEHDKNVVLDKVRAEIEQDAFKDVNGSKYIFINQVNQIIDKYKSESELKDGNVN